ncbi:trehalose-phosphatase [Tessaracoccus sp. SD287]|uniref:trehalose-phosphatase n=1 Tax=Tessaracoccus sp. SD287 TaxID=2782008 RepID=UPI001A96FF80|nr:trehalose-phosphatase [Tessaracoccus sp. SD287]MBO1032091.1 trehalose-phosphatase [Tessaracoccus sp. SD287]
MNNSPWRPITERGEAIIEAIANDPFGALVASDFDGTLSPIVDDPSSAHIHPDAHQAFARVGALVGQPAIITGRGLASVRELGALDDAPGLERLLVKAQYGVETWDARTNTITEPPLPPQIGEARARMELLLTQWGEQGIDVAGVGLEDKGRALGVHTRRTADPDGMLARLEGPVRSLASELDLHLEPGRLVWELRATPGTKAQALDAVLATHDSRIAVMIGDDLADVTAFDRLHELAGSGLVVAAVASASDGEQPVVAESADVLCDGPAGVAAWLNAVADAIEARR